MKELRKRVEEGVVICWWWIVVGHGVCITLPLMKIKVKKGAKAKGRWWVIETLLVRCQRKEGNEGKERGDGKRNKGLRQTQRRQETEILMRK
ncbi:MAG: hypothetical protein JOS17DRAFT_246344 [Linnemannia elongata]|nr:MAG: hypothetical protein JOS17DRAFT_246344 [Linnemannia elongata]